MLANLIDPKAMSLIESIKLHSRYIDSQAFASSI